MLLVVRTQARLAATQAAFPDACGLAIATTTPASINLPSSDLLLITSQAALAALPPHFSTNLACVGTHTAQLARQQGLNVKYVAPTAAALAQMLVANCPPKQHFVHIHGDRADKRWHRLLRQAEHTVTAILGYKTIYIPQLPEEILTKLRTQEITNVALFSANAAKHLLFLLTQANISPHALTAWCLSANVAKAAQGFGEAYYPPQPTLAALKKLKGTNHNG